MNLIEAAKIGREKALKTTGLVVGIYLFINLLHETRGDFGNGILFFFQDVLNAYFLIMLCIIVILTYILGGKAGKAIILDKKNFVLIGIKYAAIVALAMIIYPAIMSILTGRYPPNVESVIITALVAIVSIQLIWLWAAFRMRSVKAD